MIRQVVASVAVVFALGASAQEPKPDVEARGRAFVELLEKSSFKEAAAEFNDTVRKLLPADKLGETWKSVSTGLGGLKRIVGTRKEKVEGYDIVFVTCDFDKGLMDVRVVYEKDGRIGGFSLRPGSEVGGYKPPPYVKTDSFTESEVTVGDGEWKLPGTLTKPKGDGPFAAVVLVHGSGPNDRDETIGPTKTFRDIAWGLATKGIAVLRYDKRTRTHGKKITDAITIKEETIDDALEAVAMLRKTKGIDPKRVYVIGHSLGAVAAPRIGELDAGIAGLVMMAGNARPLEDVVVEQIEYLYGLDKSVKEEDRKKAIEKIRKQAAKVKDPALTKDTPKSELPLGAAAPYWLALREYNQTATALRLKQPLLILQGERDYQVTMTDFELWKKKLAEKKNATFKSYADLNHLYMTGKGKATPTEYLRPGHVAVEVIDDIAAWIK